MTLTLTSAEGPTATILSPPLSTGDLPITGRTFATVLSAAREAELGRDALAERDRNRPASALNANVNGDDRPATAPGGGQWTSRSAAAGAGSAAMTSLGRLSARSFAGASGGSFSARGSQAGSARDHRASSARGSSRATPRGGVATTLYGADAKRAESAQLAADEPKYKSPLQAKIEALETEVAQEEKSVVDRAKAEVVHKREVEARNEQLMIQILTELANAHRAAADDKEQWHSARGDPLSRAETVSASQPLPELQPQQRAKRKGQLMRRQNSSAARRLQKRSD